MTKKRRWWEEEEEVIVKEAQTVKGILHNKRKGKVTQSRVGPLPPSVLVAHSMEDRVPHGSFDVGPHVFVEAFSRAAVMPSDFERFSYLQVVGQFSLVFVGHLSFPFRLLCRMPFTPWASLAITSSSSSHHRLFFVICLCLHSRFWWCYEYA